MGFRSVFYTDVDRGDANPILPAEVYTVVWQQGPFITGTWPGSTPAAPTTTFDLNDGGSKIHIHIGYVSVGGTGTVTIEIQLNGVTVETFTQVDPTHSNYEYDYFNPSYPAQDAFSAGDQYTIVVTNGSDAIIKMSNDEVEAPLIIQVDQFFSDTPIPTEGICPEVFVVQPGTGLIPSYLSSDQSVLTEYDTTNSGANDRQPWDLAFKANEDDFEVTAYDQDLERSITLPFTIGTVLATGAAVNHTSLIDEGNPFAIEIDHDNNRYLLGYLGSDLMLNKFDSAGVLQWSEVVDGSGVAGVFLSLDIATDSKAYYTECGANGLIGDTAYLYCFNTTTRLQEAPALTMTSAGIGGRFDTFGGFRLLLDPVIGGCAINRLQRVDAAPDYNAIWVDIYDRTATLIGQIPVNDGNGDGADPNYQPSCALCFGEDSDKIWIGKQDSSGNELGTIYKFDLNTFVNTALIVDSDYHGAIKSCTAEEGPGFGFQRRRFVPVSTVVGAN